MLYKMLAGVHHLFACPHHTYSLEEWLKSLCLQRIELLPGNNRVVNKALHDLGAESLPVINDKVEGATLSRCPALHIKRGVRERKPRSDFN